MRSSTTNATPVVHGNCATCNRVIVGDKLEAGGKVFHPEHFQCGRCQKTLRTENYFEIKGSFWCDRCYETGGVMLCAQCNKPIIGKITQGLGGKNYHPEHFICIVCKKSLDGSVFLEQDGKIYCEKDYDDQFSTKCADCGQVIQGECMQDEGKYWHLDHFKCAFCRKLIQGNYFMVEGKLCCENDYGSRCDSTCASCSKGITGDYLEALGKRWHTNHFLCSYCSMPLGDTEYKEDNGMAYCYDCAFKLLES